MSDSDTTERRPERAARRQEKVGTVVSNKMDKTVVVAVANTVDHRLYHRSTKRTSKFAAHDPRTSARSATRW